MIIHSCSHPQNGLLPHYTALLYVTQAYFAKDKGYDTRALN